MPKYDNFSRDELIELLQKQDKELARKKYGLVWDSEKEPEQVVLDCAKKLPVLKSIAEKDIKTCEDDDNIMIEGDNYHALQVLNYTHKGKIDVIYIDPPYNTGKDKEWKYNDKYVDKNDGYRHSKWLNFMEKRLDLAKELLKSEGCIFISIDDNEQANLKLLCDKVFGEKNFVGMWNWYKSETPPNLSKKIKKNVEYVLAYEKVKDSVKYKGIKKVSKSSDPFTKPQNTLKQLTFPVNSVEFKKKKGIIKAGLYGTSKYPNKLLNDIEIENYRNVNEITFENKFIWVQGKLEEELEKGTKVFCSKSLVLSYKKANYEEEVPPNLISGDVGVETTEKAGDYLEKVFGKKVFDYPKPVSLIKYLCNLKRDAFSNQTVVLDFFAGSGTTGQAVLELNKQDGGSRKFKFIICTNNEGNIATEVCYPRIKKVMQGYNENGNGNFIEGLGGNLKYFKTDFVVNSKNKTQTKINLAKQCSEMLCLKTGIYNLLDDTNPCFKVFNNNRLNKFLCVYFDFFGDDIKHFIDKVKTLNGEKLVFMFSLDENVDKSLFEGIENITIEPIPQKILDVYKKIAKEHIKGDSHD